MLSILHHYMDTMGYFITLGFALFYIFKGIFYSDCSLRAAPSAAFRCIQWDRWPRSLFRPTLMPDGPPPQHPCLSFVSICCKTSFLPWNVLYNILTLKIPTLSIFLPKGTENHVTPPISWSGKDSASSSTNWTTASHPKSDRNTHKY